jgi:CRISPR-associated protein Cas1
MERRTFRLPKVGHGLRRLVCISDDGYVSLSALTWLSDVSASFILLDRRGRVRLVTGPTASSDSKLRRAQAFAVSNGVGLETCRTLIHAKLEGQERLLREQLNDPVTARAVEEFRHRLAAAENIETIRILEAQAAVSYFGAWRHIEVLWPKSDLRKIPERWRLVGVRQSPLSGGPRLAVTPVHAMINYCAALLESESRLALSALGLLPDLGLGLHTDRLNRDSLVFDVCEPVRPQLENWLLAWVMREPLCRADFFETGTGNVRLMSHLCSKLSEIAPTLGKLVSPWAEYVVGTLWTSTSRSKFDRIPPTHLTQQHRREAKGQPSLPTITAPKPDCLCRSCGVNVTRGRR